MKVTPSFSNRKAFLSVLVYCFLFFPVIVSSQNVGNLQTPQSLAATPPTILLDSLTIFEDEPFILDLNDPAIVQDDNTPPALIEWDAQDGRIVTMLRDTLYEANVAIFEPQPDSNGTDKVKLIATDMDGQSSNKDIHIKVISVHDIHMPKNLELIEGTAHSIKLDAYILLGDSQYYSDIDIEWSAKSINRDVNIVVEDSIATFYPKSGFIGFDLIEFEATCKILVNSVLKTLSDVDTAIVTIVGGSPPEISFPDSLFVPEDTTICYNLNQYVSDDKDAPPDVRWELELIPGTNIW